MQCPACSTEVPPGSGNLFCEECGATLASPSAPAAHCACGAPMSERDEDGFCLRCGRKLRLPQPEDRIEDSPAPELVAVSDRGLRHDRNEDRFAIHATSNGYAIVVCDGVSTSHHSEIASAAVCAGVLSVLSGALETQPTADPEAIMKHAIAHGSSQLEARLNLETRRTSASRKLRDADDQAPSTTVVAAFVANDFATIAWVGDSRAYWIEDHTAIPLTRDHSWMNDTVAAGEMTAEQAAKSRKAHAITRWIGPDSADCTPDIFTRPLATPGYLVLCTDGLWNYLASPADLATLVHSAAETAPTPNQIAATLVQFALDRGGDDNITAAVLEIAPDKLQAN